nr:flagellar M-ring protein FliF C-terminal domain-containing protein [Legionella sp. PL877]
MVTHEKETQHSTATKTAKAQTNQDITREKSYEFGREKEHFIRATGSIERLTISVVVPQSTPKATIEQITRLVKSVVGFEPERGDSISVEALINHPHSSVLPETPSIPQPPWPVDKIDKILLILASLFALTGIFHLKNRYKKRRQLLSELTQWLDKHD